MNYEAARSESTILHVFPFSSEKKRGGVAVKLVNWKSFLFLAVFLLTCLISFHLEVEPLFHFLVNGEQKPMKTKSIFLTSTTSYYQFINK